MEKQRIYDEIISVSISNAGAERQRNGICLIRDFDPDNPRHMLYYEASLIYCSVIGEPLYLCSFRLEEDSLRELSALTEGYLMTQLEHSFSTLDFYKSLLQYGDYHD